MNKGHHSAKEPSRQRISIVIGYDNLIKCVKSASKTNNNGYCLFIESAKKEVDLLNSHGYIQITKPEITDELRSNFLREYVDLIGTLGKKNNSISWWATDISSKNRFTSKLYALLQQFFIALYLTHNNKFDHLILYNPSWIIVKSLRKSLRDNSYSFTCYGIASEMIKDISKGWIKGTLVLIYLVTKFLFRHIYVKAVLKTTLTRKLSFARKSYVIKSFIYDHSFVHHEEYRDVIYGPLLHYLKLNNKNVVIYAFIPLRYIYCINRIKQCLHETIVPIEYCLRISDIFACAVQLVKNHIVIEKDVTLLGHNVNEIVQNEMLRSFYGIQYYQLLHYWSSKNLFSQLSIETFLMTYENNPWEKMCIMAAKELSPKTVIIGYQHAVVTQASVNMFPSAINHRTEPVPDKILTVGDIPKTILEKYGYYRKDQIEAGCGLNYEHLFANPNTQRRRTNTILLALEGVPEVSKMVNYVVRELHNTPYTVMIRTHPTLPLKKLKKHLTKEIDHSVNIVYAGKESLKYNIEHADIVMYWGSTVGIEALCMGKPVINYQNDSLLSYDPLFECKHLKWAVTSNSSLMQTIENIYSLTDDSFQQQWEGARTYINNYFNRITENRLGKFLYNN